MGVYNTPVQSGRVNAVNVLKGVTNNIQVARLKAINVLRDANTRIDIFGRLERRILLEANRIAFLYTAASTSTTDISRLEQFDVGSYPGDFKLQIVGQNADYNNNLISWYLNDNDVLTPAVKSTSTTRTVYFNQALYTPFSVGTRIKISSSGSNSILYYATVTSVTSNSVSFVKPNIDIPISNTYIEGGSSVYPRSFVQPSTYPTNARENLYFFELAPAIRNANKYQSTLINRFVFNVGETPSINKVETTYTKRAVNPVAYPAINARERLYFFELAPAIQDANKYQNTLINRLTSTPIEVPRIISANINFRTKVQLFNTVQNGNLTKAFEIVRGDTIRSVAYRIELQKITALSSELFSLSPAVYQLPKAFEIVKGSREVPLISLVRNLAINKDRVQLFNTVQNGNLSKAFEIVKDVFNTFKLPYAQVIRLKTGDGKNGQRGVQDPTFRKKAPIQFWN